MESIGELFSQARMRRIADVFLALRNVNAPRVTCDVPFDGVPLDELRGLYFAVESGDERIDLPLLDLLVIAKLRSDADAVRQLFGGRVGNALAHLDCSLGLTTFAAHEVTKLLRTFPITCRVAEGGVYSPV